MRNLPAASDSDRAPPSQSQHAARQHAAGILHVHVTGVGVEIALFAVYVFVLVLVV
jgi:hypothetical protein